MLCYIIKIAKNNQLYIYKLLCAIFLASSAMKGEENWYWKLDQQIWHLIL